MSFPEYQFGSGFRIPRGEETTTFLRSDRYIQNLAIDPAVYVLNWQFSETFLLLLEPPFRSTYRHRDSTQTLPRLLLLPNSYETEQIIASTARDGECRRSPLIEVQQDLSLLKN
jgi:hypothetical protein